VVIHVQQDRFWWVANPGANSTADTDTGLSTDTYRIRALGPGCNSTLENVHPAHAAVALYSVPEPAGRAPGPETVQSSLLNPIHRPPVAVVSVSLRRDPDGNP
jgi:hypothetical protein